MAVVADMKDLARKVSNYEIDATGATAHWPDTTHYRATCPVGCRWYLIGGTFSRGVSAIATIVVKDASDDVIYYIHYAGAATGASGYPVSTQSAPFGLPVIDAGEYLEITFTVAQNAASFASAVVLEVDA